MTESFLALDIDGVLNSRQFLERTKESRSNVKADERLRHMLDPDAIVHLNAIMAQTGAKIVISSSWRLVHTIGGIKRALRDCGFEYATRVIDKTPYSPHGDHTNRRGIEIQAWLKRRWGVPPEHPYPPPKLLLAILDDDSDLGHLLPHLVRTTYEHGLTHEHVAPVVKLITEGL